MYTVDDPTLALITRFVGILPHPEISDTEFFHQQVAAIEAYVARFPPQEQEQRAMAWIEANARRYRQKWEKLAMIDVLANARCPDCPLSGGNDKKPCAIHARWLQLLRRYAASELSSRDYVKTSLELLAAHKDRLKVRDDSERLRWACPTPFSRS